MPISYSINSKKQTVYSKFFGHVTNAEIIAHQDELNRDRKFDPEMKELMDCTCEVSVEHKVPNVMRLVESSPWGSGSRRAVIAPDPLVFGRSKLFQAYISVEHGNISVFRGKDKAMKWLDEG